MYLDRSKILSFFFFSLSCRRSRACEAKSAAGPGAARPCGPASTASRSPPFCRVAPLCAGAGVVPFDPATHACAEYVRRLRGAAHRAGALLGNIWRRLRRGPADMAAVATVAWLPAAILLFVAQVRASPAPLAPPDAMTRPLGPRPRARPPLGPAWGQPLGPEPPARTVRGPGAPP